MSRLEPVNSSVLVVEDDAAIRDVVATALEHLGYEVTQCGDGLEGLRVARAIHPDLVILDVMLPSLDGFDLCQRLRDGGQRTPVLFLTARTDAADRIKGFVTGGDDYLTKPFNVDELGHRVTAILRRAGLTPPQATLRVGDLTLDPAAHEVQLGGAPIDLSPTEFALLHYLMINVGTVVSKSQILVNVWDDRFDGSDNVVELYVGYLRRKVDQGRSPMIQTRRGIGYVLQVVER